MAFKQAMAAFALATTALMPVTAPLLAQDIHTVENPAALGFDPYALSLLDARLDELAAEGARPGYAAIIARGEQIAFVSEAGEADLENHTPFTVDTPVRIASMTKPVTAVAIMMLVERGEIALDDPVSDYIPAFADVRVAVSPMANEAGEIETRAPDTVMTIEHLLTHTAGLGYIFEADSDLGRLHLENTMYDGEGDLAVRVDRLAGLPLYGDPGDRWMYSYGLDVAGRVIEIVSGQPLNTFFDTEIFTPLGMEATGFFYEDVSFSEDELAPLYVHDENGEMVPYEFGVPTWPSGGGGLVSTASDYIRFAMLLANGGHLGDVELMSEETFAVFASPHATGDQLGDGWDGRAFALGMDIVLPAAEGQQPAGVPGDLSWGGLFDTDFFVSPQTRTAAVIMTQIQPSQYRPEPRTLREFRPRVYASFAFD
ncbi:serine hydrolase domain-containing protein [Maricaulis maris]|uniref:CubicO group peptidase (Beta-lactamase class C family) n=1 Tax=Maricaulis maris TaxID=74318 RepID=A0A495DCQ2_9PROT|nr:serine hydrolase domain-containing protein [Maricaulis maris]RKR00100.1 CubicO group peptidase (beta-lactamase class C family) [Maricaulis maris]